MTDRQTVSTDDYAKLKAENDKLNNLKPFISIDFVECPAGSGKAWYSTLGEFQSDYCGTPEMALREILRRNLI